MLEAAQGPEPSVEARLVETQFGNGAIGAARQLVAAWRIHMPQLSGASVALALSAAASVHEKADKRRPRLVVSGPTSNAVPVRLTSAVVVEIIRAATQRLLLVSFAAYNVADVVRELVAAQNRGVELDLVLESSTDSGGALRGRNAADAFTALVEGARFWHWPSDHRPTQAGQVSLHAKVVVADGTMSLIGSANFTGRGLSDNIEVGMLVSDPGFAGPLDRHFRSLMRPEARCLTPVT